MAVPYLLEKHTGAAPVRVGLAHPGICPYGVFTSADGVDFVLSVQNEAEWQRLCSLAVDAQDLLTDPRCKDNQSRVAHRQLVDGRLAELFAALPYAQLQEKLAEADMAFAPVNSVAQLRRHGDFRTQSIQVGGEAVALPVVPGRDRPDNLRLPGLGEHTQEVREWLESGSQ
jgi:formyl-CoA transferase